MPYFGRSVASVTLMLLIGIALAPLVAATPSSPSSRIRPNQVFGGLINGSDGHPNPAVIRMACVGPIKPGQTGHPMGGQTVTVFTPEATSDQFGFTGSRGTSVGAFFGAPPPTPSSSYVRFTHYREKAMPTSLTLPCAGSGSVTFVPLPLDPSARSVSVPVRFVGQP